MTRNRDAAGWERRRRPPPRTAVDVRDEVTLETSAAEVFERLLDVDTVALCLPGVLPGTLASVGAESVTVAVRQTVLGVTATWQLGLTMKPDSPARALEIRLSGTEPRLGMKLEGDAALTVRDTGLRAAVLSYRGHVEVEGRLAVTGGPVIRRLIDETLHRFVAALAGPDEELAAAGLRQRLRAWLLVLRRRLARGRSS